MAQPKRSATRKAVIVREIRRDRLRRAILIVTTPIVLALGGYYLPDLLLNAPRALSTDAGGDDWAMFRRTLAGTGAAPGDPGGAGGAGGAGSGVPQGAVRWSFATGGPVHSSPAVVAGTVYVGSRDGNLYALDASTGVERWRHHTTSWVESSPVVAGGVLFFGSNDGSLRALDAGTGRLLWRYTAARYVQSTPAVAGELIYFFDGDRYLNAVEVATGKQRWRFLSEDRANSGVAVANGLVYGGSLYALRAGNGTKRLHYRTWPYPVHSTPAVSGETVYVVDVRGYMHVVDGVDRNWPMEHRIWPYWLQLWAFRLPVPRPPLRSGTMWGVDLGRRSISSPALDGDMLYVGVDERLVGVDLRSRAVRWELQTGGHVASSPAVGAGAVYVGSDDGRLYAADAASGELLWTVSTGGPITSSPAVADGIVYVGSHDGNIYAVH